MPRTRTSGSCRLRARPVRTLAPSRSRIAGSLATGSASACRLGTSRRSASPRCCRSTSPPPPAPSPGRSAPAAPPASGLGPSTPALRPSCSACAWVRNGSGWPPPGRSMIRPLMSRARRSLLLGLDGVSPERLVRHGPILRPCPPHGARRRSSPSTPAPAPRGAGRSRPASTGRQSPPAASLGPAEDGVAILPAFHVGSAATVAVHPTGGSPAPATSVRLCRCAPRARAGGRGPRRGDGWAGRNGHCPPPPRPDLTPGAPPERKSDRVMAAPRRPCTAPGRSRPRKCSIAIGETPCSTT